jgi:hypothetical protein
LLQAKENDWQIRSIIVMDDVDFLKNVGNLEIKKKGGKLKRSHPEKLCGVCFSSI